MAAQWLMKSKIGPLYLVASAKGLQGVFWRKQHAPVIRSLDGRTAEAKLLARAVKQLEDYFAGKRREFDLPLDPEGSAFQKKVWKALSEIPYGETCSYAAVARRIRNPKAVRAVGGANGKNPLCIVVPCHRVINASGKTGGYSGPKNTKRVLLALERAS